jgi:alpha-tubulin suppressor-like RCC1 family protein
MLANGTVWSWGNSAFGQLGNRTIGRTARADYQPPQALLTSSVGWHSIALRSDGH